MASLFRSTNSAPRQPYGLFALSDHFYEIYYPEVSDGTPQVDVVFVHGLNLHGNYIDAHWKSWSDGKTQWPNELLGRSLPRARILAVLYDPLSDGVSQIADALVTEIIDELDENERPVVFVAHSLGGIVVKEFLMRAKKILEENNPTKKGRTARTDKFFKKLSGVFYFATPHDDWVKVPAIAKPPMGYNLFTLLNTLREETKRINKEFKQIFGSSEIPNFSVAEGKPTRTSFLGTKTMIVDEASATHGAHEYYTDGDADHFNVCKFRDQSNITYHSLVEFISRSVPPEEDLEVWPAPPAGDGTTDFTQLEPEETIEDRPSSSANNVTTESFPLEQEENTEDQPSPFLDDELFKTIVMGGNPTPMQMPEDPFKRTIPENSFERSTFQKVLRFLKRMALACRGKNHVEAQKLGSKASRYSKINESLYRLYNSQSEDADIEVDIIFFHGLQSDYEDKDAYWKSWSSNGTTVWPETLLGERTFKKARVLAVSYNLALSKAETDRDGVTIAVKVILEAILNSYYGQRPVILVGHSIGGLIIKMVLLMAYQDLCDCILDKKRTADLAKLQSFIENVRGVFYYATPQRGCKVDLASVIPGQSALKPFLVNFEAEEFRINEQFSKLRKIHDISTYSVAEGRPLKSSWLGRLSYKVVVEPDSANYDCDDRYTALQDDHVSICKPKDIRAETFQLLEDFIVANVPEVTIDPDNPQGDNCHHDSEHFKCLPEELQGPVTQINGSVFLLYRPDEEPEVDIVFFHGLQIPGGYKEAFWRTWNNEENKDQPILWPKLYLGEKALRKARILSVSYDSSGRKGGGEQGHGDIYNIGEALVHDIIDSDGAAVGRGKDGRSRPVILVGHSLGGLVIKMFLLQAFDKKSFCDPKRKSDQVKIARIENFIDSVRGVFYYATPHRGSLLANFANATGFGDSKVLDFLNTDSADALRLNLRFRQWRRLHNKVAFSAAETRPMSFTKGLSKIRFGLTIVAETSARYDVDGCYMTNPEEDHSSICKPKSMSDPTFLYLLGFILENVPEVTYSLETGEDLERVRESIRQAKAKLAHWRTINYLC